MKKLAFDVYVDGEYECYEPFNGEEELRQGLLSFYKGFCVPRKGLDELTLEELVKEYTMKTIKINGRNLESALSLEETLFSLNLQLGAEYGTIYSLVLKVDLKGKTYTYTPATTFENMTAYILEWFDEESYSSSSLVSDLTESFVSLVFKLDNNKGTYCLSFSGDKDEYAVIEGPFLSKDMIKSGVLINAVESLQDSLERNGVELWPSGHAWFHGMESQLVFA